MASENSQERDFSVDDQADSSDGGSLEPQPIHFNHNTQIIAGYVGNLIIQPSNNLPPQITTRQDSIHLEVDANDNQEKSSPTYNSDKKYDLRSKLKDFYKRCTLPCIAWLDNGQDKIMDEYYIELELDISHTLIPVEEIFAKVDKEKTPQRILIEGQPGYGKTTLATKIVHDWALSKPYIDHFKLVFLIRLRYLQKRTLKQVIEDITHKNCGFTQSENIDSIIQGNKSEVLLIVDGLDELPVGDRLPILKLLYNQDFPEATVIATCRTGLFSLEDTEYLKLFDGTPVKKEFHDKQINIMGIGIKDRESFLLKFVKNLSATKAINEQIQKLPDFAYKMFKSPLFLILLAFMEEKARNVASLKTKTQLFKRLFNYLVNHSIKKNLPSAEEVDLFEVDLPIKPTQRIVQEFGQLSLKQIRANNVQFEHDELTKQIHDMGFLINHKEIANFTTTDNYEAFHLTILEFAVAFSIWIDFKENPMDNSFQNIVPLYLEFGQTSTIFSFLVGLLQDDAHKLFQTLLPHAHMISMSSNAVWSLLSDYEETSSSEKLLCVLQDFLNPYIYYNKEIFNTFTSPHFPTQILKSGIRSNKVKFVDIGEDSVELIRGIYIPNILVTSTARSSSDTFARLKKIKCEKLTIRIDPENFSIPDTLVIWKNVSLLTPSSKTLEIKFQDNIGDIRSIQLAKFKKALQTNFKRVADIVPNLLRMNLVEEISLRVNHPNYNNILRAARKSSKLRLMQLLCTNSEIDLHFLTNGGKKSYRCLVLFRGRLICEKRLGNKKCVKALITFKSNVKGLNEIDPSVLKCKATNFDPLPSWTGYSTLEEYLATLDASSNCTEFWDRLTLCKKLKMLQVKIKHEFDFQDPSFISRVTQCIQSLPIETLIVKIENYETSKKFIEAFTSLLQSPKSAHSLKTITLFPILEENFKEVKCISEVIEMLLKCLTEKCLTSLNIICDYPALWSLLFQRGIIDHSVFSVKYSCYGSATSDPSYYQIMYNSLQMRYPTFCIKKRSEFADYFLL